MINLIRECTCFPGSRQVGTCIDHFATSDIELYEQHGICPIDISYHYMIFASCKKFKIKHDKVQLTARKYKHFNEGRVIADIEGHNWDRLFACTDASLAWDMFVWNFNKILGRHAPWKKM